MMTMTLTVDHRAVDGADGRRLPAHGEAVPRRARRSRCDVRRRLPRVWYLVRDFDRGRDFYKRLLGFDETFVDWDDKWSKLEHGAMRIALAEGEPIGAAASRRSTSTTSRPRPTGCAAKGVEVGVVLELAGQMRLVDVFDPDGNRVQLAQPMDD